MVPRFELLLAKEDFKFSAAHFTVFGADRAELLHGHNYRVRVEVNGPRLDALGFLVAIEPLKRCIRAACARLDNHTLVPATNPHLELVEARDQVEVRFADRSYSLPRRDVLLLAVDNTTIELLAQLLWQEIAPELAGSAVAELAVTVEETAGQRCRYRAPLVAAAGASS